MIKWLFNVAPEVGSTWRLSGCAETQVVIVAVSGNLVIYRWLWDTKISYRNCKTIRDFRFIYRLVKS